MKTSPGNEIEGSVSNIGVLCLLTAFFLLVAILNGLLFMHYPAYPKSMAVIFLMLMSGILYGIGFPLGLWLHASKFVRIEWKTDSLQMKRYLKFSDKVVDLNWAEISAVGIVIDRSKQDSISEALKTLKQKRVRLFKFPGFLRRSMVSVRITGQGAKTIEITSEMFGNSQLVKILKGVQTHLSKDARHFGCL